MSATKIIIIGGGFAGVKCAKTLRKLLSRAQCEIVVFNRENHMTFHPLLAELAGGAIGVRDVAAPLRQLLRGVQCRSEDIINVDLEGKQVEYEAYDGQRRKMRYDHVVIACGSVVNLGIIPGMDDHAFALKTVGDALALQGHIMDQMEKAEVCDDTERRRRFLSFVVVGGGFSGVELAGEINDLVRGSIRFFHNIKQEDVTVTLVHSRDQILPEVTSSLRDFAQRKMQEAGVRILLNATADAATPEGVALKGGVFLPAGTVVCTIGNSTHPLILGMKTPKERGRLVTEPDMSLPGYPEAWSIGDCAAIVNELDKSFCPPVGQFAERQGVQVAHNIVARINRRPTKSFAFKMMGQLCSIGERNAVAEIMGLHISGFPAWFVWRGVYLLKLPSFAQSVKVAMKWGFELLFPRTLAHLRNDTTKRIGRAHYSQGDFIFRQGEPATDFYVIKRGEVEILHSPDGSCNGNMETIAILGPGDFFGEAALMDSRPRSNFARARTEAEVVLVGRSVFTQISSSLGPLSEALAMALKRRTNVWQRLPEVRRVLDAIALEEFIEPLPSEPLHADSPLSEAVRQINQHKLDFCCVVDDDGALAGILTRSDLLRAMEVAAASPTGRARMKACDIMVAEPIALTPKDSTTFAVTTMREHGLKRLPVVNSESDRRIKGYLRIENILEAVIGTMQRRTAEVAKIGVD